MTADKNSISARMKSFGTHKVNPITGVEED